LGDFSFHEITGNRKLLMKAWHKEV